ncbi:hypothetical protein BCV69DRAFT_296311 [Microstroma glucosiphilum]|uniref:RING-type domain-containing protein n=1 Tax=Pseudomicrostroma glucosiphilum TaxID=1684307 RepID=A0A316UFJ1_9BASI|nr:hypothetical protein BCV69DRAFT_296311 [Pseudomicrostroma glucosiphilum]PWN24009.1 hypothetical protein BCV69DRAFT_296311 [Pseudomicrostroma glucosiphilum]
MDRRGVASSRKRPRIASSPPLDAAHPGTHTDESPTEPAPGIKRSKSALKREKKRVEASARREAQGPSSAPVATQSNSKNGAMCRQTIEPASAMSEAEALTEDLEGIRGEHIVPVRNTKGKSQKRHKAPRQDALTPSTSGADQLLHSDPSATNATSGQLGRLNDSLAVSLGGARAAMKARDMEAAAAAAVAADREREHTLTRAREEQEEASKRAQQQALIDAQASLNQLRTEFERLQEENRAKDRVMQSQSSALSYLYGQASCAICLELAFRPHVLSPCGHTFCARCLIDWFQRPAQGEVVHIPAYFSESQRRDEEIAATRRRKKICPHCRGDVRGTPAEVWSIKGMIDRLDLSHRAGHFVVEGGAVNPQTAQEERYSRGVDLGTGTAIWEDIFDDRRPLEAIYDEAEGIYRCPNCTGEIVGIECCSCGAIYSDLEPDNFEDGSGDEESDDSHASGLPELYEPTLAATMGLYDPHPAGAENSDYPYEDDEESSIGSFIVDDNPAGESASHDGDDDDGDESDLSRIEREAERVARSASRRYGYSSDEGAGESDASDSSDSNSHAEDDAGAAILSHRGGRGGQPLRGAGASAHFARGRQRAAIVLDSDDDDEAAEPESVRSAAAARSHQPRSSRQRVPLSSDDEDEDNDSDGSESENGSSDAGSDVSVSNDVEDAADADRWLSYAGGDSSDDGNSSEEDSDDDSD